MTLNFSVLMVTYDGENEGRLYNCLNSIVAQTLQPNEVILCLDGKIRPQLTNTINNFREKLPLKVFQNTKIGLAKNLNYGLNQCSNDLIIRCDSDDINLPDRFATQVLLMVENENISVSSTYAIEELHDRRRLKTVPKGFVRKNSVRPFFKNPINHHSCILRKSAVQRFGYTKGRMEDYRLWMNMLSAGHVFYNITNVHVIASADGLTKRRNGSDFRAAELELMKINFRRNSIIGKVLAPIALALRYPLRFEVLHYLLRTVLKINRRSIR
jgi:glycosyltransferase involved in cell wall biosynthesis